MYSCLIVDDEKKIREVLQLKLERYCPNISKIELASNAEEAFNRIKSSKPDIVFLDISMPGESGFDFLDRFENIDFEIIFATGFGEYAIDAFKVSAVDYIMKPFKNEDVKNAVKKAVEQIDKKSKVKRFENLKHNLKSGGDQSTKIAIANGGSYEFVQVSDIIRCEGWQKYCKIFKADKTNIVSSYNIGHFVNLLVSNGFYQTHKSHLINTTHIKEYNKEGVLYLTDGSSVPVSRRKKEEFVNLIIKNK